MTFQLIVIAVANCLRCHRRRRRQRLRVSISITNFINKFVHTIPAVCYDVYIKLGRHFIRKRFSFVFRSVPTAHKKRRISNIDARAFIQLRHMQLFEKSMRPNKWIFNWIYEICIYVESIGPTSGHCAFSHYNLFVFREWTKETVGHVAKLRSCVASSILLFFFPSPYQFSAASALHCQLPARSFSLTESNDEASSFRALWHATSTLNLLKLLNLRIY